RVRSGRACRCPSLTPSSSGSDASTPGPAGTTAVRAPPRPPRKFAQLLDNPCLPPRQSSDRRATEQTGRGRGPRSRRKAAELCMDMTPSQKPTREGPLLVLALALVCAICFPLWQWSSSQSGGDAIRLTPERLGRLLLGPEQIASYCAFTWAGFILLGRYH